MLRKPPPSAEAGLQVSYTTQSKAEPLDTRDEHSLAQCLYAYPTESCSLVCSCRYISVDPSVTCDALEKTQGRRTHCLLVIDRRNPVSI